jgi:hypothetical protein
MPGDATVTIAEPKHGSAGATETPDANRGSVSPEPPEAAEETSGSFYDATPLLESLSYAALKKWKLTGLLPPDVEIKTKPKRTVGENEATLKSMSAEERKTWRETGHLPEKKASETSAKSGETRSEESETVESHPLAKIDGLRAKGGADVEVNAMHFERQASHSTRYQADQKRFSKQDQGETMALAKQFMGQLPQGLLNYFDALQIHLEHPYTFFREFTRNAEFRGKVLRAAGTGDVANVVKEAVKFDGALISKNKAKLVSSAPAPPASISGHATAPIDESESALRTGNFKRYRAEENRREHLRLHGRRS